MIPSKEERFSSDTYIDRQNRNQQEQGWKRLLLSLITLALIVSGEYVWIHSADDVFIVIIVALSILFFLGYGVWVVTHADIVTWQNAAMITAVLSTLAWLVIAILLQFSGGSLSYFIFGVIFSVSTISAFFSYPPALYLGLGLGLVGGILGSVLFMPTEYFADIFKIDILLLLTGLILSFTLQQTLTHWYRAAIKHIYKNYTLNEELGTVALIDATTGLQNEKCFSLSLMKEVAAANRDESPLHIIVLSVDSLRLYRMTYGHTATVKILRRITRCMRLGLLRPRDFVGHLSSDEFGVILPGTDFEGAAQVVKRLERLVLMSCSQIIQTHLAQPVDVRCRILQWNPNLSAQSLENMIGQCRVEFANERAAEEVNLSE
ncbi:GGDEF domain-containing protein [Enterovibrio makurazakiensis]|uniref:GGDEF domain-containing protein n=1 Tax=Enterovibrio makurazakiensis TaxID=2910232 RepID=UPI003D23FFCC